MSDVVKGQERPLMRETKICPEIHGTTGLDGPKWPEITKKPVDQKAVIHMFNVINSQKEKVHIVCTAAMTNVALLLTLYPEVKPKIAQIVFMGGAIGPGNTSPAAEFNIECDPEAAKIVLDSGLPIVMVPLEVTHTCLVTPEVINRIKDLNSNFSRFMIELLYFFKDSYFTVFNFTNPPLHDPCAIAYVIDPEMFKSELMRVDVETSSKYCDGRTVCDIYKMSKLRKNVTVTTSMNVNKFWDMMIEAIIEANKVSILNKI
jgi:inosine-uridine nucleoside N-ribohydrolase